MPAQSAKLARTFERFAAVECGDGAPTYRRLAEGIAGDDELLAIAGECRSGAQPPNLMLAAVHLLLIEGRNHPLSAWFPSVHAGPPAHGDPCPAFRDFCRSFREEIISVVRTRTVQTNEVRRCTALIPALAVAERESGGRPLALIEVGASAGLNLLFDRYGYSYSDGQSLQAMHGTPLLRCEVRGPLAPPVPQHIPDIAMRLGIDLHPVFPDDADGVRWLRALVWPDHQERANRLEQALTVAAGSPPRIIAGDALDVLPEIVDSVPTGTVPLIYHSHTLAHFTAEARQRFVEHLMPRLGDQRELLWLSCEGSRMDLAAWHDGKRIDRELALRDPHGSWLEWRDHS